MEEKLLTSDEVAAFLRVEVVTIRRLVSRGELSAYRVGSEYRFARGDIEEFLQRQRVSSAEEMPDSPSGEVPLQLPLMKGDRFDKFNDQARRIFGWAQEEAQRFQHNYIGTEHLLLGLLREDESVALRMLHYLGVERDKVRSALEFIMNRGEERKARGQVGLTPRAKKAVELAVDEARRLHHHYIGTEHLFLGLVREGDGIAAGVLNSVGVNLEKARKAANYVLTPPAPPEAVFLVPEEATALTCNRCQARNPTYFRYCFNCGLSLASPGAEEG